MSLYANSRNFYDICKTLGRKVIYSNVKEITEGNVVNEVSKANTVFWENRDAIDYLDKYYRGNQPILYRQKIVRSDINNKAVENHAFEIVEFFTALNAGEPIQYIRKGTDENVSEEIQRLNDYMYSEDKEQCDIEIMRWRSICGTAYRFVYMDTENKEYDEAPFGLECLDPRTTYVCYSTYDGKKPLFSCTQKQNDKGQNYYVVYTSAKRFEITNGKVTDIDDNGIGYIPVIEYPNNERRIGEIEIVITLLDAINKIQSDRINGIEQFVQAFMLFKNCEVDENDIIKLKDVGALLIKSLTPGTNADAKMMTAELDQQQTQTSKNDIYDNMLSILGIPSREQNTGGDTGQAVYLRNGWDFSNQRFQIKQPIFNKSEKYFIKMILHILSVKRRMTLKISDVDIKANPSNTDNMSVKANVLLLLLQGGIDPQTAIKTCKLWSDPEAVYLKSKELLEGKYKNNTVNKAPAE